MFTPPISAYERRRRDSFAKAHAMFPTLNELGLSRVVQDMWDAAACVDCKGLPCKRKLASKCRTRMITPTQDGDAYIIYDPCKYSNVPRGKFSDELLRFLEHQAKLAEEKIIPPRMQA